MEAEVCWLKDWKPFTRKLCWVLVGFKKRMEILKSESCLISMWLLTMKPHVNYWNIQILSKFKPLFSSCNAKFTYLIFFYRQEIIEFPAVLLNCQKGEVEDEFRSYCRPVLNPLLTEFCTELTGITQVSYYNWNTKNVSLTQFFSSLGSCWQGSIISWSFDLFWGMATKKEAWLKIFICDCDRWTMGHWLLSQEPMCGNES